MCIQSSSELRTSIPVVLCVFTGFIVFYAVIEKNPSILILLIVSALLFRAWIVFGRTLFFDQNGCSIKFLCFKKKYSWDELKTKRMENFSNSVGYREQPFVSGVVFCPHQVKRPYWIKPASFNFVFHSFDFFFVYFSQPNVFDKQTNAYTPIYLVEKELFLEKLKQWNVAIENLDDASM